MPDLSRLLRPKSIAVVGGGVWCRSVIEQIQKIGFDGDLWPVHPKADQVCGVPAVPSLADLSSPPDATFIGVNRSVTVAIVSELETMGAGGAVCFASGFLEAAAESVDGSELQRQLLAAAGDMPILGPNCYGFINALDGALLWPDQHGMIPCDSGVALITQSSNMAINITMQNRALPIAYVVTAGNQAQIGMAQIGTALLEDPRVTALGLHVEGFNDLRAMEVLSETAKTLGKPIVALKVGRSEQAQTATISHTASVAGGDAGAQALLDRLNIARVDTLPTFLETLKLLHITGSLPNNRIASISCSGGEASLAADISVDHAVTFPPLNDTQQVNLRDALGPMVALANPLDYHTYIWRDTDAMTKAWAAMMDPSLALTMLLVDFPRADRCDPVDWECAIQAALNAKAKTGANVAMVATLPELMPEDVAMRLMQGGVVPINGLKEAIAAAEAAAGYNKAQTQAPLLLPGTVAPESVMSEADVKSALAAFGVPMPQNARATSPPMAVDVATRLGFPVVLKGEGVAHKTEAGAVALNLNSASAVEHAAKAMPTDSFLVEEMITDVVAEVLVGVVRDPAHGYVLTIGAGGVLTELLQDSQSLLIPSSAQEISDAVQRLKIAKVLNGYRGKAAADLDALNKAIMALQDYVLANADGLAEIEINPLLCTTDRAVAADALLRLG